MNSRTWLLGLSLVLAVPGFAGPALPTAVQNVLSDAHWQCLGQGEMRWYGLALYQASLWTRRTARRVTPDTPFAFVIEYERHFSGTRLASTSISEMRRLRLADENQLTRWDAELARIFPNVQLTRWDAELARIFPNVKTVQTITGINLPGQGVRFFHHDKLIGSITDPAFGRAFFGIWLHEQTRATALRNQLLGKHNKLAGWTSPT